MATLKRSHAPMPWGARVEQIKWERSRPGKPRRRRLDRPPLRQDPGWDWDGTRVLFSNTMLIPDAEEDFRVQAPLWEEAHTPVLSGRAQPILSLLDVARHQVTRRPRKAGSGHDDFEVIRVPKVVPISEEEPDLWDSWGLGEWEKLDVPGFKRSYSDVARQGFVEGRYPSHAPGCSRLRVGQDHVEDDSWECL